MSDRPAALGTISFSEFCHVCQRYNVRLTVQRICPPVTLPMLTDKVADSWGIAPEDFRGRTDRHSLDVSMRSPIGPCNARVRAWVREVDERHTAESTADWSTTDPALA